MNDIETLERMLEEERVALARILKQILPLHHKKQEIQENIDALERLIAIKKRTSEPDELQWEPIGLGHIIGKSPIEAYEIIAREHFGDRGFREKEIRKVAHEQGLRVGNKPISDSYSRTILLKLTNSGFLEKVERGLYKVIVDAENELKE